MLLLAQIFLLFVKKNVSSEGLAADCPGSVKAPHLPGKDYRQYRSGMKYYQVK